MSSHSDTFLLRRAGYQRGQAFIELQSDDGTAVSYSPDDVAALAFNTSRRYCVGWHDITSSTGHTCPDRAVVDATYDTCAGCQKRTGFNPAFYHAQTVSPQQEARNRQPHDLYLAYFGAEVVKVGISHHKRQLDRLLEQGARCGVILATLPSALIARSYEEKIARLPGVKESVQIRQKKLLFGRPFDEHQASEHLQQTLEQIRETTGLKVEAPSIEQFDSLYFPAGTPATETAVDVQPLGKIAGETTGLLGSFLFKTYDSQLVYCNLKAYTGYRVTVSDRLDLELAPQQTTLF